MVSKARLDLPEPERPVITTSRSRGISTSIFFRLCSRAPRTTILVSMSGPARGGEGALDIRPAQPKCHPVPGNFVLFSFRAGEGSGATPGERLLSLLHAAGTLVFRPFFTPDPRFERWQAASIR